MFAFVYSYAVKVVVDLRLVVFGYTLVGVGVRHFLESFS